MDKLLAGGNPPKVSVVLNGHNEGQLLYHSILSVSIAIEHLASQNLGASELIVVLDCPDNETSEAIARAQKEFDFSLHVVSHRDLGLSRNTGVSVATGEYVAFIDADDLWCATWLSSAVQAAYGENEKTIFHPEINYYFGYSTTRNSTIVSRHIDSGSDEFDVYALATGNYWTSPCFAARAVFIRTPYRASDKQARLGFEDWTFNIETLVAGFRHTFVPHTVHFIRNKPSGTMRADHSSVSAVHFPVAFINHLSKSRDLVNKIQ